MRIEVTLVEKEHVVVYFTYSRVMTNETSNIVSESLHHRRKKPNSKPIIPPVEEKKSIVQRFTSLFTSNSKTTKETDDKYRSKPPAQRSCFRRHICCNLILVVCAIWLVSFFRPDYSIHIRNTIEEILKNFNLTSEELRLRPGQRLAEFRQPSMPIIIIPGIISTGLELWQGTECATGKFRHRFWTSMQMVDNIGRDHQCWLKHISLNLTTWYVNRS